MIDAHVHVFAKDSDEFPRDVDETTLADREETAEQLLETMSLNGVEKAVLVQIGGCNFEQHAYLLHCLREYPDRFRGIGLIADHAHPEDQMDRLAVFVDGETNLLEFEHAGWGSGWRMGRM